MQGICICVWCLSSFAVLPQTSPSECRRAVAVAGTCQNLQSIAQFYCHSTPPHFTGTPAAPTALQVFIALSCLNSRPSGPRLPKMPQLQDFQFFQVDRLNEIYEKEQAFELHKHTNNQKEAAARAQVCLLFCVTTLTRPWCALLPS